MQPEEVWKANQEKTAFIKNFPGQALTWEQIVGKRLTKAVPFPGRTQVALLFDGGSFAVAQELSAQVPNLLAVLQALRPDLESMRAAEYQDLDRLVSQEKELQRQARQEKILNAVRNHLPDMPELKQALLEVLSENQK